MYCVHNYSSITVLSFIDLAALSQILSLHATGPVFPVLYFPLLEPPMVDKLLPSWHFHFNGRYIAVVKYNWCQVPKVKPKYTKKHHMTHQYSVPSVQPSPPIYTLNIQCHL